MSSQAAAGIEFFDQPKPVPRTVHHPRCDGVVQHDHRVVRHPFEDCVERENLRPVCVHGSSRFVVKCGDGGPGSDMGQPIPLKALN